MTVIIAPQNYDRWLSPRDLLPYPAEPMKMWTISARVNRNDDASILNRVDS
jgi:hypothetical protein